MTIEALLNVMMKRTQALFFIRVSLFDVHIQGCVNKANKIIGIIKRTFIF